MRIVSPQRRDSIVTDPDGASMIAKINEYLQKEIDELKREKEELLRKNKKLKEENKGLRKVVKE